MAKSEMLKTVKNQAKAEGKVFKQNGGRVNGVPLFCFYDKRSGLAISAQMSLSTAFNNL